MCVCVCEREREREREERERERERERDAEYIKDGNHTSLIKNLNKNTEIEKYLEETQIKIEADQCTRKMLQQ